MPRPSPLRALTLALLCALGLSLHRAASAGVDAPSLEDLHGIAAPGTPGELAVWGPQATVLVAGMDDKLLTPVAACGLVDRARVVALAHTGLLEKGHMAELDTGRFVDRVVRWSAHAALDAQPGPRVALLNCALADFAKERGWRASRLEPAEVAGRLSRENFDTVCIVGNALSEPQVRALAAFAKAGGGIVAAQTAWAWNAPAGKSIHDNPLNRLFAPAGIAWTNGYSGKTGSAGFLTPAAPDPLLHAGAALDALQTTPPDAKPSESSRLAANTTITCARALPADDVLLRPRLAKLVEDRRAELIPTPKRPLTDKHPLLRTLLAVQLAQMNTLPPEKISAHPAAEAFPGAVPASAKRATRACRINTAVPEWHSTGLYAAPGESITITIPAAATGYRLEARIGCHKDGIWKHGKWERVPEITRSWPLAGERTTIASPFGGPVYIDVAKNTPAAALDVTIAGAVEAPLFIRGQTTVKEWQETIRQHPAPWAELGTDKVIVSVPSIAIRTLDNPDELLALWDSILDAAADLATIPRQRARPERYVADQQISAGYMHSGYPIMTHLDAADDMVSAAKLRAGTWGLFHELGHNHQASDWTFDGTGEVTVNLFSLYIMEKVCGKPMNTGHGALDDRAKHVARHKAKGRTFDSWKSDPFLALVMYQQLREAFGWETYQRVFAEYRDLKKEDRPKGEAAERDQWMMRFSRACGKDLGPFFEAWGVPISAEARATVADLPDWMPSDWPGEPR